MKKIIASLCLSTFALLATPMAWADVIVPGSLASVEGNANNGFPFNVQAFGLSTQRYQQVYGASAFPTTITISGLDFRRDSEQAAFSGILPSIQIDLSTTSASVDGLSAAFASNVGSDNLTVFSGSLSLASSGTGTPNPFDIHIQFDTPFTYNPLLGNLLLDVRNFGGGITGQFDAVETTGDAVSRVFSFDVAAANGITSTYGLVTKFDTTSAVPEPSSFVLTATALAAVTFLRRRR